MSSPSCDRPLTDLEFLSTASIFADLPQEVVSAVAVRARAQSWASGAVLVRPGVPADAIYVIRRGTVEVCTTLPSGAACATVHGPGEVVGEECLQADASSRAVVRAREPLDVLVLTLEDLHALVAAYPAVAQPLRLLLRHRARPSRVPGVSVSRAVDESGAVVLKPPVGRRYVRLTEPGHHLWQLMDGDLGVRELTLAYFRRYRRLRVDEVLATIERLRSAGFVTVDAPADFLQGAVGRRRVLQELALRAAPWIRRSFSIPHPDRLVTAAYRGGLRLLFRRPVQVVLVAAALLGGVGYVTHVLDGGGRTHGASTFLVALIGMQVQVVLHEMAHAVTAKHFGREVHAAGVGWYFFSPVAFVDTSDMWLETSRRRAAVAAAGPYVNFVLAGVAGCLLWVVRGGVADHLFAFATTAYLLGLANLNPLFELDGYFILSDLLEIPNLRAKALVFWGALLWRGPRPSSTPRERRIYFGYGLASVAYLLLAAVAILFGYGRLVRGVVSHILPEPVAATVGWSIAGLLIYLMLANLWVGLRAGAPGNPLTPAARP